MRLLTQNHTQPLLLFDEILRKGFDGHNFIVGLSEHLRNLLVSQDARTTNLMEVPESVKKKYAQQAQSVSSFPVAHLAEHRQSVRHQL